MLSAKTIRERFHVDSDVAHELYCIQAGGWRSGLHGWELDPEYAEDAEGTGVDMAAVLALYTGAYHEGVKERERRAASGIVCIGTLGDGCAEEYGGGKVFRRPDGTVFLEYTHGVETEAGARDMGIDYTDEAAEDVELQVYSVEIEEDVLADLEWVKWRKVADSMGMPLRELHQAAVSDRPMARACVYQDVASYYGWHELDQEPLTMTYGELQRRWEELPEEKSE